MIFVLIYVMLFWGPPSLLSNGYRGALTAGVKRPGSEVDHSPHLVPRSKMRGMYLDSPKTPSWHGTSLSTGTTLPLLILSDVA